MKKKSLAIMLTAAMVMPTMAVSAEEPTKLTVWAIDGNAAQSAEYAAEIYKETHPDVEIEVSSVGATDLEVQITTAATAGDYSSLPDIVQFQDYSFEKFVDNYPDLFYDLTDVGIPFEDFSTAKVDNSVVDGKNYGVPFDNGVVIAAYRTDILEQAGYTVDDLTDITWDEFIAIGEVVKEKTDLPLLTAVSGEPQLISIMLTSAGSSFFNEDGSVNIAENATLAEAVRVYTEMVEKGILLELIDWEQYNGCTANGLTAGIINGCWCIGNMFAAEDQTGLWGMTNMPRLDVEGGTNYSNNGGASWAVVSDSENAELAADFLKETFAGSVELADKTLEVGNVLCYLPAAESDKYQEGNEFFGGDTIYAKFMEYAAKIPSVKLGAYYYDGIRAVSVATSNVIQNGSDIVTELQGVQETLEFNMGM